MKPVISVVVPAHNEEKLLPEAIGSIRSSFAELGVIDYEIIVVDDVSTDATARISREMGVTAKVSDKRNIGATRNIGAAAAKGETIIFMDADTRMTGQLVAAVQGALRDSRIVGGGAVLQWSEPVQGIGARSIEIWNRISRLMTWPAGGFFFVRADAFRKVGGFDEEFYASEELHLGKKLKSLGRLRILSTPAYTSPRKIQRYSAWELLAIVGRIALSPKAFSRDRSRLGLWYNRR